MSRKKLEEKNPTPTEETFELEGSEQQVAPPYTPQDLFELAIEDQGQGSENIDASVTAIPTLRILQKGSHEVDQMDPKYVQGAEQGMFFAFGPKGPVLIPGIPGVKFHVCHFEKCYIEWVPVAKGGGFVARYPTKEIGMQSANIENELKETWEYYVIVDHPELGLFPSMFGCTGSKLGVARKMNSVIAGFKAVKRDAQGNPLRTFVPPSWFYPFNLTTKPTRNEKGSWHTFEFETLEQIDSAETYQVCKGLRDAVRSGVAKGWQDVEAADEVPVAEDDGVDY